MYLGLAYIILRKVIGGPMLNKLLCTILIILIPNLCFSDCSTLSVIVKKGDTVPCDGYLLSPTAAQKADQDAQNLNLANQQITVLTQENSLKDDQIKNLTNAYTISEQKSDLFSKEALSEAETITEQQKEDKLKDGLLFGAGVVTTVLIFFIVNSASKNAQ